MWIAIYNQDIQQEKNIFFPLAFDWIMESGHYMQE